MARKWFSMLFDRRFVIKCVLHWCPVFFNAFGTHIKSTNHQKKRKKKQKNFFFYFFQLFFNWFISCVLRCCYYYSMAACCCTYSPVHSQPMQLSFFLSFRIHSFNSSFSLSLISLSLHFFADSEFGSVFFFISFFLFLLTLKFEFEYVTRLDHSFGVRCEMVSFSCVNGTALDLALYGLPRLRHHFVRVFLLRLTFHSFGVLQIKYS